MNRITQIHIKNFKSLVDTEIVFAEKCPITCIVGLNASGKSTLIQAIDFIGQLMRGDIDGWLASRNWKEYDLASNLLSSNKRSIIIDLKCVIDGYFYYWSFSYNISLAKCTIETISRHDNGLPLKHLRLFSLQNGQYRLYDGDRSEVDFTYQGSLLSQLKESKLDQPLAAFKNFIASICSFDPLSPSHIKSKSRESNIIDRLGGHLAGYLYTRSDDEKARIAEDIKEVFPWFNAFKIKNRQFGLKEILIGESRASQVLSSSLWPAQQSSDGAVRLMALFAALYSNHGLLLFDEIENGLNPHIIKCVVEKLLQADKQLVVTTHSPEILQYFPDDLAEDAMSITIKNEDGSTQTKKLFDLPEAKELLKLLGPGEVFLMLDKDNLDGQIEERQA